MSNRHYIIYGLVDPESKQVRYVGKSVNGIVRAKAPHAAWCENWRQSLFTRKLKPQIIILESFENDDHLDEREAFWIAHYRELGARLTNLTNGGEGRPGCKLSPEHRAKLLVANTGRPCSAETRAKIAGANRGKKRTPEQRERNAEARRGLKASDETRAKMSQTRKGQPLSDAHVDALKATWRETHTEKSFEKIAASKRGKPRDAATRTKLSASLKGKPWSDARRAALRKDHGVSSDRRASNESSVEFVQGTTSTT